MASYTKQQQQQQNQQPPMAVFNSQMSVLAQAKPAIVSPSTTNSFSIPTGALSEKINSALKLSSASLSQQQAAGRTDISKLFSNYANINEAANSSKQQRNLQRAQHIEDENVLMKQNASNQMRQAAVLAAQASQQKVRLSATERLAMTAKRPATTTTTTTTGLPSSMQSRQTTTDNSNSSSTPLTNASRSTSSLPTLETLLAVQRQLQQHTRQNLNSVPASQHQMVINNIDKEQHDVVAASKQQQNHPNVTLQSHNESAALGKKPLPPSPPRSPDFAQTKGPSIKSINNEQESSVQVMSYPEKELPPLPQSISPSTNSSSSSSSPSSGATTDDSQMNSLESHQSSPATSLVSIPPPPPPISSYLEQYDEVNSACRQSNSSTPSTIATSDISSVRQYPSFVVQNTCPLVESSSPRADHHPHQYQEHQYENKPTPPALAPKPTQLDYQRVLQNQTNHFNQKNATTKWADNYNQTLRQQNQIANMKREFSQLVQKNSYSQQSASLKAQQQQQVTDSDSNESSSASNVSYDISYKPQLNYQQHVFTRTSASLPSMPAPLPPPPPPPPAPQSFSGQTTLSASSKGLTGSETTGGSFDEVDSAFRFPTPPPLDMLLDNQYGEDDDVKKPTIQGDGYGGEEEEDDEDFQCRIPTPPHQRSMSTVSFQDLHSQQHQEGNYHKRVIHRQQSLSPPSFKSSPSPATTAIERSLPSFQDSLRKTYQNHLQEVPHQQQANRRRISPQPQPPPPPPLPLPLPLTSTGTAVSTPQLTVHISNNNESGLLSTAAASANNNLHHHQSSVNHHHSHHHHHHHHMTMLTSLAASSSSPSSSSDGDGQSSNSSSSTSGIHSSIDSPSSSNSKLDDFNYSASKLRENACRQLSSSSCLQNDNLTSSSTTTTTTTTNNNLKNISTKLTSTTMRQHRHSSSSLTSVAVAGVTIVAPVPQTTVTGNPATIIKPALKQKKTVSFSDKVELVACAEEQCEDHLPNPLLARVLAGKLQ